MTRQTRTLLVLGVIAAAGVSALAYMAHRYSQVTPKKSVMDLTAPSPPAFFPDAEKEAAEKQADPTGVPPAASTATAEAEPTPSTPADPAPEVDPRVQGFLAGRRAVKNALDENPLAKRIYSAQAEERHLGKEPPSRLFNRALLQIRTDRARAASAHGMTEQDYRAVLREYRKWLADPATADPELAAGFEVLRDELAETDLGSLEMLDVE